MRKTEKIYCLKNVANLNRFETFDFCDFKSKNSV